MKNSYNKSSEYRIPQGQTIYLYLHLKHQQAAQYESLWELLRGLPPEIHGKRLNPVLLNPPQESYHV